MLSIFGSLKIKELDHWSQLSWRIFGLGLLQLFLLLSSGRFRFNSVSELGVLCSSILLIIFGPKILVLITTFLSCTFVYLLVPFDYMSQRMVGEEYLMTFLIPFLGIVNRVVSVFFKMDSREAVVSQIDSIMFRLVFFLAMAFAVIHKLNTDFFNPQFSCAFLTEELLKYWDLECFSSVIKEVTPFWAIFFESAAAILPFFGPIGFFLALLVLTGLGALGATGFVLMLVSMLPSFIGSNCRKTINSLKPTFYFWLVCISVFLSWLLFAGIFLDTASKGRFIIFVPTQIFFIVTCLAIFFSRNRESKYKEIKTSGMTKKIQIFYTLTLSLLLVVNNLSPYLGLKYRWSFAMLSNLRVDSFYWNSLVFPERIKVFNLDNRFMVYTLKDFKPKGIYSSAVLWRLVHDTNYNLTKEPLILCKNKKCERFEDPYGIALKAFLKDNLGHRLFQNRLPPSGPQKCKH